VSGTCCSQREQMKPVISRFLSFFNIPFAPSESFGL
jgi:hypothetical protein